MNSITVSEFEVNAHIADEYYRLMTKRIFSSDLYILTSYKNRVYSTQIFLTKNTKINKYVSLIEEPKKRDRVFVWYRIINFFEGMGGK